jgi:ribonuclease T2
MRECPYCASGDQTGLVSGARPSAFAPDSSIGVPQADAQGASRRPSSAGRLCSGLFGRAGESERGCEFVLALFRQPCYGPLTPKLNHCVIKGVVMVRFIARGLLAFCLFAVTASIALAQDKRQNQPGQFDFYVLSLSWSPSFCAAAAERASDRAPGMQCGTRAYSFIVLGLWPQYESGFPEYCQVPAPRLDHGIVSSMLDLMPAPHLIFNEWDRHGTCSGLSPTAYFEAVRKARAVVKIPPEYLSLQEPLSVAPSGVEEAFIKANSGLAHDDMAVECDKRRLTEIRICLSRELQFRPCPQIAHRSCRQDQILMPPVRGSAASAGRSD